MRKSNPESGQALIELIVFLPLIVTLYSVIAGFASSINGSINQQKVARAYFYYRIQNNSSTPGPNVANKSWSLFGIFYIGWKERFEGDDQPVMPCYKVNIPFKNTPEDNCDEAYSKTETTWVRVGTVYGICGATYSQNNGDVHAVPDGRTRSFAVLSDPSGCIIE